MPNKIENHFMFTPHLVVVGDCIFACEARRPPRNLHPAQP